MVVRQAANVLELIEYFSQRLRPATLSEISDDLGWPRSSTFNIVDTLLQRGYIYTPDGRFGYYPSPRLQLLADAITSAAPIPARVYELIASLAEETGETVSLAAPAGLNVTLVHVVESKSVIRYSAAVGKLLPIHTTAAGRAVLSQMPAATRDALLAKVSFTAYQPNSLMSRQAVLEEIEISLSRGWFQANTEFTPDVCGLAFVLPIMGRKMSVAIGGPSFRMQPRMHELGTSVKRRVDLLLAEIEAEERPG